MTTTTSAALAAVGSSPNALFTLKAFRGEGMTLLGMNWKSSTPPDDFVGFAIEYKEPNGEKFYSLKNRICFPDQNNKTQKGPQSSLLAPFQKFRWVHFPRDPEKTGEYTYRVTPVFMNSLRELSYGEAQQVALVLKRETYEGKLNISFTRGFISSQAFSQRYEQGGGIPALIPSSSKDGLSFIPTHPQAKAAYQWMGFEARSEIHDVLLKAIEIKAEVRMVAYELNIPELVALLVQVGNKLTIIIDDSAEHKKPNSAESIAANKLLQSGAKIKRQHMGNLQHNKMIIVEGADYHAAICGSTNFSWRGVYVQANNALAVYTEDAIAPFRKAFDNYWLYDTTAKFGSSISAGWTPIPLDGINAKVTFSPHSTSNSCLNAIASDLSLAESNIFYSLAFLFQTPGVMQNSIKTKMQDDNIFIYGISDKKTGGLEVQKPDGNISPVYSSQLSKNLPEPFISEASGGRGNRMHHKFIVLDFDKPTARVYLGSYNFSDSADGKNGENLVLIQDPKAAVSYMIEALRLFDHYHFRVAQNQAKKINKPIQLELPPIQGQKSWWHPYYQDKRKIKDRLLFS